MWVRPNGAIQWRHQSVDETWGWSGLGFNNWDLGWAMRSYNLSHRVRACQLCVQSTAISRHHLCTYMWLTGKKRYGIEMGSRKWHSSLGKTILGRTQQSSVPAWPLERGSALLRLSYLGGRDWKVKCYEAGRGSTKGVILSNIPGLAFPEGSDDWSVVAMNL